MRRLGAALAACAILLSMPAEALADPPDNDEIATSRVVDAIPYADGPYDTTEATTGATDPSFCFNPSGDPDSSTVWYSFTPSSAGFFLAETFGSDYDTTLYVGTPDGAGGMEVIACNDDSGEDVQSAVLWEATAGTQYLVMVGTCCGDGVPGEAGGGGTLQFHVDEAAPPPTIEIAVSGRGSFTKAGAATIRGTITCENAAEAFIDIAVTARVGRLLIHGFGEDGGFSCDGTAEPWSVDAIGQNGLFRGGRTTVEAFGQACGAFACTEDFVSRSVRLRR